MRPRVFPAEDLSSLPSALRRKCYHRFNEAAGIPRGRRLAQVTRRRSRHDRARIASMRPRVFPAEDHQHGQRSMLTRTFQSFNEAAGIPRGRRRLVLPAVLQ